MILFFWQICQRWIVKDSVSQKQFHFAPAVVSGLLVFSLITGYEIILPSYQSAAVSCDSTPTPMFWWRANSSTVSCGVLKGPPEYYDSSSCPGACPTASPSSAEHYENLSSCYILGTIIEKNSRCIPEFPPFFSFLFTLLIPWIRRHLNRN